jgi:serine/threonine protein kinase
MLDSLDVLEDSTRVLRKLSGDSDPGDSPYRLAPQSPETTWAPTGLGPPPRHPAVGHRRLLSYELGEQIGAGGMGTVYRAQHLWLGRTVAIKFISPQIVNHPEVIDRFRHEARAIGALDHPNIVRATDAGQIDGACYLVTEFVTGRDLGSLVDRQGRLEIADACEAIRQAALGLEHAHQQGLVHRDIKPSNLIVDHQGTVKLLDFGLARVRAGQTTLTSTGQVLGTLDFLAPEQAADARLVDPRSDLYSLGCTLYYLLAGAAPFSGPAYDTAASKIKGHLTDRPPPVNQLRRKMPLALVACLDRMMAKSPDDRFDTAAEVADALQPFCEDANLAVLVSDDPQAALARQMQRKKPGGKWGIGEMAERLVSVFGWALRGSYSSRPADSGNTPRRTPFFSVTGLAMFAGLGFVLSHFTCVPLGDPSVTSLEEVESDGGVRFVEFGYVPPPTARPIPPTSTAPRAIAPSVTTSYSNAPRTRASPQPQAPPQPPPQRPPPGGHPPPRR